MFREHGVQVLRSWYFMIPVQFPAIALPAVYSIFKECFLRSYSIKNDAINTSIWAIYFNLDHYTYKYSKQSLLLPMTWFEFLRDLARMLFCDYVL